MTMKEDTLRFHNADFDGGNGHDADSYYKVWRYKGLEWITSELLIIFLLLYT